jgi:hypothetical protein
MITTNYVLLIDIIYIKHKIGFLHKCLTLKEALLIMYEGNEWLCEAYHFRIKIRLLIMNHDFYWPRITKNCMV